MSTTATVQEASARQAGRVAATCDLTIPAARPALNLQAQVAAALSGPDVRRRIAEARADAIEVPA